MAQDERAAPITRVIAEQVRRLRLSVGLSHSQLAERVSQLGPAWTRSTAAKLENRRRESLTVQELLALSLALRVPLPLLLADPRHDGPVPVAEGYEVGPWEALLWLVGEGTIDGPRSSVEMDLIAEGRVVAEMAANLRKRVPRVTAGGTVEAENRVNDDLHRRYLETMRIALENIEAMGAPVPNLGPHVLKRAAEVGVDLPGQEWG